MGEKESAPLQILSGWKEIANYLGKGVRTVQRYQRDLGLPIHRLAGKASAIAIKSELDGWISAMPVRAHERRLPAGRTNKLGADFLQIDSEIALTFSGIALQSRNPERRISATRTARKAYDAIMRLRKKIDLNEAQRDNLDAKLRRLKSELQSLGEHF